MEEWIAVYPELSAEHPGLLGSVTARAEPMTMRLALLYAAIDGASEIRSEHLNAALALWKYSFASARFIFGHATGDPAADSILSILAEGSDGATRTEISNRFGRHLSASRLSNAIATLLRAGRIVESKEATRGRPSIRYRLIAGEK